MAFKGNNLIIIIIIITKYKSSTKQFKIYKNQKINETNIMILQTNKFLWH